MMTHRTKVKGMVFAILAAALYAISTPVSKLLLNEMDPTILAGLLYLGAGAGMLVIGLVEYGLGHRQEERKLERSDLPYIIGMVALDIAAPICLLAGLNRTNASTAALLNNFEIVATALIALALFKEKITGKLWCAIILVTASSIMLSIEDVSSIKLSPGSLLILLACVCWGLENNCTRKLSAKNPIHIVTIKGFGSGAGALAIGLAAGNMLPDAGAVLLSLLLGFVAYGLSIFFYIYAQRDLGAAKTSTFYAAAPFVGTLLSLVILGEHPNAMFYCALAVMLAGAYLAARDAA